MVNVRQNHAKRMGGFDHFLCPIATSGDEGRKTDGEIAEKIKSSGAPM
jgi:hypothetical protein